MQSTEQLFVFNKKFKLQSWASNKELQLYLHVHESALFITFESIPFSMTKFVVQSTLKWSNSSRQLLAAQSKAGWHCRKPIKNWQKLAKMCKRNSFPIRWIENVVDTLNIFRAPGFEGVRRGLHATIGRYLILWRRWCMRCRFSPTLLPCIVISRLFRWYPENDDKDDSSVDVTGLKLWLYYLLFLPRYPFFVFFFERAYSDVDSLSAELLLRKLDKQMPLEFHFHRQAQILRQQIKIMALLGTRPEW